MDTQEPLPAASSSENALAALTSFINPTCLLDLARRFSDTYTALAQTSTQHFLVTPVTALPTGKEKGKFISIDVGGTNLRVGLIELLGEEEEVGTSDGVDSTAKKIKRRCDRNWPIEEHLKVDKAEDLFAWIGDCIAEVVTDAMGEVGEDGDVEGMFGEELLLGITFSFPMAQTTLSEATLLPMGKGFAITSDLNLGQMLLAGYASHINSPFPIPNINNSKATQSFNTRPTSRLPRIRIAAITNDTVATFASLAYIVQSTPHSRVAMGLIVGTGTNATVPMKPSALHPSKIKELANPEAVDTVVINTEWTIRGTDKPLIDLGIKTKWDLELDSKSEAPGFQPFEYMTAGRYLGELVRIVFVDVVAKEKNGTASTSTSLPPSLLVRNALPTRFLAEVVARANEASLTSQLETQFASASLETPFWNQARAQLIKRITYAVQQRSSALIAAACIGLLACVHDIDIDIDIDSHSQTPPIPQLTSTNNVNTSTTEELVIAYAGGTISQYPEWLATCQKWIDTLVTRASRRNAKKRVVLREALDGGIVGAGVLAAMADGIM